MVHFSHSGQLVMVTGDTVLSLRTEDSYSADWQAMTSMEVFRSLVPSTARLLVRQIQAITLGVRQRLLAALSLVNGDERVADCQ